MYLCFVYGHFSVSQVTRLLLLWDDSGIVLAVYLLKETTRSGISAFLNQDPVVVPLYPVDAGHYLFRVYCVSPFFFVLRSEFVQLYSYTCICATYKMFSLTRDCG